MSKTKKKIKIKLLPVLIFLIAVVLLYLLGSILVETKIKNIYISGNKILSDQEIIELAEIEDYPSFYKTYSKTIKKKILKSKYIKDVKINKDFFNVLRINVVEYRPLFIYNDKLILDNKEEIEPFPYKVPTLSGNLEESIYNDLIKKILDTNQVIYNHISQIIYSPSEYDKERFLIYMDDGNHIYINLVKWEKLNYYDEIYETLNNKKGTLYLDSGNHFEVFK